MTIITVKSAIEADEQLEKIWVSAARAHDRIKALPDDPMALFRQMKFEPLGHHPIEDRRLNLVEQINQTWTYAVALGAAKRLFQLHPDIAGYNLAPGAHASQKLDIMSIEDGVIGAETFAAVTPKNNGKLEKDLLKLSKFDEKFRYVFFSSPRHSGNKRWPDLEKYGVEVWSVEV